MSIELADLKYLGLYEEPSGSYQVDRSGTPGDFLAFPYIQQSLTPAPNREALDPQTGRMRADTFEQQVLGVKRAGGQFSTRLHSHGLDCDGDVAPPTESTFALMRALKICMGGVLATGTEAGQTTVEAGSTSTVVNVTTGHGDRFTPGHAAGFETVSGSSALEVREVLSVAGDAVTLKQALTAAPVVGQPVRGSVSAYLTERPDTTGQILVESREADDRATFRGLNGGFSVEMPLNELGTIAFDWQGAAWDRLGSSAQTIPSYSNYNPFLLNPVCVIVGTVGSTAAAILDQSAVTFEPQLAYEMQISGKGTNGVVRQIASRPPAPCAAPSRSPTKMTRGSTRGGTARIGRCSSSPATSPAGSSPSARPASRSSTSSRPRSRGTCSDKRCRGSAGTIRPSAA